MLPDFELSAPLTPAQRAAAGERVAPEVPRIACDPLTERFVQLTGMPFLQICLRDGRTHGSLLAELIPEFPRQVVDEIGLSNGPVVWRSPEDLVFYGVRTAIGEGVAGCVPVDPAHPPVELVLAAADAGWPQERLNGWLSRLQTCSTSMLMRLLRLAHNEIKAETALRHTQRDVSQMAEQLDAAYEELNLLYSVTRHLRVGHDPERFIRLCLGHVHECMHAEGSVVMFVDQPRGEPVFNVAGQLPVREGRLAEFIEQCGWQSPQLPIVRNHVPRTPLGREFRGIDNCVAVALWTEQGPAGWIAACNGLRGEFGTPEANLLTSVGQILSTHLANVRMFRDQDDLVVGFVRSMVSALDAKDRYTSGHSQRVARIARRLGRQLQLPEAQIEDIYMSGLLHDIGKVGLRDDILNKPGKLTDEEFRIVQQHPVIGYEILSGLKNVQNVLPGVLHHHENFDGTGYPHRLAGREIPLMARILAVADAYDAMGSSRSYRAGMPIERVESILADGAGVQWDPDVVKAFQAARDDIRRLWLHTEDDTRRTIAGL